MTLVLAKALLFADTDGPTPVLLAQAALSGAVPLVLAGPIAGFVADRWPRKQILVSGQAFRAAISLAAAGGLAFGTRNTVLVAFVIGLCATRVLFTARVASVRHLVRQHELVAADSLMQIVGVAAATIGGGVFTLLLPVPAAGQLVVASIGHFAAAYAFDRTRTWLGGEGETSTIRWRAVFAQLSCGKTRYATLSTASNRLLVGCAVATIALDVDGRTDGSASGYALTLGVAGVSSFAGSVTSEWMNERVPRRALTVGCFLLAGFVFVPAAFLPGVEIRLAAVGVGVFLFQNLRVASDATIQANAASGTCGRVFAGYDIAFNLAYIAGLVLGLIVTSNLSVSVSLAALSPLYLLGSVGFTLLERDDPRQSATVDLSGRLTGEDVLTDDAPADESEGVEDRRHDDEGAGGAAVPREVA